MDWYPWYPLLFEADTMHLSCTEIGAYKLLIDHYMRWEKSPLDNDRALATITRLSLDEWKSIAPNIRPFFKSRSGRLHNKRCDVELSEQQTRATKRSDVAKNAAKARWNKTNGLDNEAMHEASDEQSTEQSHEHPPSNAPSMLHDATEQDITEQNKVSKKESTPPARARAGKGTGQGDDAFARVYAWIEDAFQVGAFNGERIRAWLDAGASAELIIAVLERITHRERAADPTWRASGLRYFDGPVREAIADRTQPLRNGNGNGHGTADPGPIPKFLKRKTRADIEAEKQRVLDDLQQEFDRENP